MDDGDGGGSVAASKTAMLLVTAEVTVDEAMLSTHRERRQQHENAGKRCQLLARAGDGDGDGDGNGVCDSDSDGVLAWMTATAAATLPAMAATATAVGMMMLRQR